jgi:hypothetical protein
MNQQIIHKHTLPTVIIIIIVIIIIEALVPFGMMLKIIWSPLA